MQFRAFLLHARAAFCTLTCIMNGMNSKDNTNKYAERIYSLDGLRGVACVAVLLLHIGIMLEPFGPTELYLSIPGTAAVMVFYVLSGAVLSLAPLKKLHPIQHPLPAHASEAISGYDWFAYYPRRIIRLCIPLFAAILLGVAAGFVAQMMGSTSRSATAVDYSAEPASIMHDIFMQFDVLFNVSDDSCTLYGEPIARVASPVWSMSWELWFSILLPLCIFFVLLFKRDRAPIVILGACVLLAHFVGYFPLRFGAMFLFGVFIAKHHEGFAQRSLPKPLELFALAGCFLLIELPLFWAGGEMLNALLQTLMNGACAALVILAVSPGLLRHMLSSRPCQWLGKISYSMYLTHVIVIGALEALFSAFVVPGPVQALGALVLSFLFAWIFWRCVERPSIAWSHQVGRIATSAEQHL